MEGVLHRPSTKPTTGHENGPCRGDPEEERKKKKTPPKPIITIIRMTETETCSLSAGFPEEMRHVEGARCATAKGLVPLTRRPSTRCRYADTGSVRRGGGCCLHCAARASSTQASVHETARRIERLIRLNCKTSRACRFGGSAGQNRAGTSRRTPPGPILTTMLAAGPRSAENGA